MNAHLAPLLLPLAVVGVEATAHEGATPFHYLAVGGAIAAIAAVLKGWAWVRHEVKDEIKTELEIHNAHDQVRHERIAAQVAALAKQLEDRPCIATQCRCPTPTPVPGRE